MKYETSADFDIVIRHYHTRVTYLMRCDKSMRVRSTFIDHPRVDVELHIVEKVTRQLNHPRWTIGVDARWLRRNPGVVQQRSEVEIVIRMVMRDENVAHPIECDAGSDQLLRRSVPAVNEIRHVINHD